MARQTAKGKAYASKLGLDLIEITDKGVSAYKDKNNATIGELATLIRQAEDNVIPSGTILIVESLDRVSRQTPLDALEIFKRLLNAGLEVHTLIDNQVYTKQSVDDNFFQLLGSLFVMQRAYDESKTKSDRIKSSIVKRKKEVIESGAIWKGSKPSWIDTVDGKVVVNDFSNVVKRIFRMYLAGDGMAKICRTFNAEGVKTYLSKFDKGSGLWQVKVIEKMLSNRAVYGTLLIDGQEVEKYYPVIVSKRDYNRVQALRAKKNIPKGRKSKNHENVFAGLMKCGCCENSLYYTQMGSPARNEQKYHSFRCGTKRTGSCPNSNLKFETFRAIFFKWFDTIDYEALNDTDGASEIALLNMQIESLEGELIELDQKANNFLVAIGEGKQIKILTAKLDEAEKEKNVVKQEIEALRNQVNTLSVQKPLVPIKVSGYEDYSEEENKRLNLILKHQIKSIHVTNKRMTGNDFNREIKVTWSNGKVSMIFAYDERQSVPFEVLPKGLVSVATGAKPMTLLDAANALGHNIVVCNPTTGEIRTVETSMFDIEEGQLIEIFENAGLKKSEIKNVMKRLKDLHAIDIKVEEQ